MECINIAGVNCRVDRLSTFTYEKLFKAALNTPLYYQKPNAKKEIDKELRQHGFKPANTTREQTKADKQAVSDKALRGRTSSKQRANSRKSKAKVEKRKTS